MHRVIQLLIGYVRIRLRLTQRMVAAGRENVNRGRARLETSGAIRQDGGCITISSRETTRRPERTACDKRHTRLVSRSIGARPNGP